jgi:hypothetical protein
MPDALTAVGDLFRSIPLKIRRTVYGVFGVYVVFEPIVDVLPTSVDEKVYAVFGVFTALMALTNSKPALPPPAPPSGGVDPQFSDEFA